MLFSSKWLYFIALLLSSLSKTSAMRNSVVTAENLAGTTSPKFAINAALEQTPHLKCQKFNKRRGVYSNNYGTGMLTWPNMAPRPSGQNYKFFCLSIPSRDLDTKKTAPNIEVCNEHCTESLRAVLEFWLICLLCTGGVMKTGASVWRAKNRSVHVIAPVLTYFS